MLSKARQIAEGWKNYVVKKPDVEAVAKQRLEICSTCPKHSQNAKGTGYTSIRQDDHCTECGCPLMSKTRCMSCDCPLKKWLAQDDGEKS